jgi:hypothetical protein
LRKKRVDLGEQTDDRMDGAKSSTSQTERIGKEASDQSEPSVTASSGIRNVVALNGVMAHVEASATKEEKNMFEKLRQQA